MVPFLYSTLELSNWFRELKLFSHMSPVSPISTFSSIVTGHIFLYTILSSQATCWNMSLTFQEEKFIVAVEQDAEG